MFFGRDVAASNRRIVSDYALPQVAPRGCLHAHGVS